MKHYFWGKVALEKQSLIKGTIILGIAGIMARFLGIFFRWPLIMLIGDEGVGYYQMSYPLYMFFVAVASGVPVAISKMVSERNAVDDREGTIQVLRKALLLMLIMGSGFTIAIFTNSKWIIKLLRWDEKSLYSLIGISFAPLFISVMSAFRGFFQGMQNMKPTAVSEIIEQFGRVIIGVGLAILLFHKGIEYSAGGAAFGAAAGGILGGIYLISRYIKFRKSIKQISVHKADEGILTKLLYIAIPISLGATVGTVMSLIDSVLVPQKLLVAGFTNREATILYGQLTGKAFVLINVPLTLSMALCASTVPVIAEAYVLNRRKEIINKVDTALKFSMVIALPSLCGLYFMASPVLNLIFPGKSGGYLLLRYLSISIPFIILAQTSTAILQGVGKYVMPVINLSIGCIVKVLFTYFLVPIPLLNVYGAIIGTVAGYITACLLNMILLAKTLQIKVNIFECFIKPALASIIMIICVVFLYMYVYNITVSNFVACISSILAGVVLYLLLITILGVFKYDYFKNRFLKYKRG